MEKKRKKKTPVYTQPAPGEKTSGGVGPGDNSSGGWDTGYNNRHRARIFRVEERCIGLVSRVFELGVYKLLKIEPFFHWKLN